MTDLAILYPEVLPAKAPTRSSNLPNLERYLETDRLLKQHAVALARTTFPCMRGDMPTDPLHYQLIHAEDNRDQIEAVLQRGLSADTVRSVIDRLSAALETQPNRKVILACVAMLLDSKTRQPANPPVYIEALTYDLLDEGFPPAVVVSACQRLRREQVFLPEIAEIVAACRVELDRYRAALKGATSALQDRRATERYRDHLAQRIPVLTAAVAEEAALAEAAKGKGG